MKRMIRTPLLAAVAMGALGTAGAVVAQQQQGQAQPARSAKDFKLTKEVRNMVAEAQTLAGAGDHAGAVAKLDAALPLAKTNDDKFIISQLLIGSGSQTNNVALQRRGIDLALDSGVLTPAEQGKFTFYKARFAYADGKYAEALPLLKAAQAAGYQDPQLAILIADASMKSNNPAEGLATLRQAVEGEIAAGRKPDENWLKRGLAVAYESKNAEQLAWWSQQSLKHYPSPQNWRTSLVVFRDGSTLDAQTTLDLMRLMRTAGALAGERDVYEYAEAADKSGLPGEVKAVIDEAKAANAIGKQSAPIDELYRLAAPKVAADKASLAASERSAATAADGRPALNTANALLSHGEYQRAVAMYRLALQKGGQDANLINTRLGIALVRSGDNAGAKQAFAQVTGPRKAVADYWTLFVDQRAA